MPAVPNIESRLTVPLFMQKMLQAPERKSITPENVAIRTVFQSNRSPFPAAKSRTKPRTAEIAIR